MYYIPLQNAQLGLFQLQYNFLLLQHWKEMRMNNSTKPYFQYSEVVTVQIMFVDKILHNCICFISVYDHKPLKLMMMMLMMMMMMMMMTTTIMMMVLVMMMVQYGGGDGNYDDDNDLHFYKLTAGH